MSEQGVKMQVEETLLRQCAQGDESAYRELVGRLEKPLVNFIFRFVGERHVAEDLFQETFVRVVRSLGSFRPDASLSTWIYTIARNLSLDYLKARRRHRETPLDAAASTGGGKVIYFKDVLQSGGVTPGERAEMREEERRVSAALSLLTPAKREALILRMYAGMSYAEIAKVVKSPVGTIKFRIHEAIQDLAKKLAAEKPSDGSVSSNSANEGG